MQHDTTHAAQQTALQHGTTRCNTADCVATWHAVSPSGALVHQVHWYTKAAMAQNARAMTNLGCCYESGEGIARDVAAAAQWYRCAAQLGAPVDRVQHAACAVCARHGTCRAQRIVPSVL